MGDVAQLFEDLALVADPPSSGISSPGAALSLALHCLLINKGFVTQGPGLVAVPRSFTARVRRTAALRPPADWQAEGPNEWNTEYALDGCLAPFKLTVALHRNAGRVFVHASEAGNLNNIQVLGLTLDVYVPDAEVLATATSWKQVLQNADQLVGFMNQHIITPLLRNAAPGLTPPARQREAAREALAKSNSAGGWEAYLPKSWPSGSSALLVGAGVGVGIAAVVGLMMSYSRAARRA